MEHHKKDTERRTLYKYQCESGAQLNITRETEIGVCYLSVCGSSEQWNTTKNTQRGVRYVLLHKYQCVIEEYSATPQERPREATLCILVQVSVCDSGVQWNTTRKTQLGVRYVLLYKYQCMIVAYSRTSQERHRWAYIMYCHTSISV